MTDRPWLDSSLDLDERVALLRAEMTLDEKLAQLVGLWVMADPDRGEVAPFQGAMFFSPDEVTGFDEQLQHGLGHATRLFGSQPVEPAAGAAIAAGLQERMAGTRLGIPAIVHEECLTGFLTLGATAFPAPLSWGATFDPELIEEVGQTIGRQMRSVGAHQGLAPVLDVVRDARWGRVEECIAEDPYLVGTIGSAWIRGLQGDLTDGVAATVKHFAGYSGSEGGRNLAPTRVGPRELADVFLVPFEMAIVDAGARSVMNAYQDNDGVPAAADHTLLTGWLRDRWGFTGVVVADYGAVQFLHQLHHLTPDATASAAAAINAGLDLELPNPNCYAAPLRTAIEDGRVAIATVDTAVDRVLRLKFELGLFDQVTTGHETVPDLDPTEARALARRVAEQGCVLLANDGLLPYRPVAGARVAVIGPSADHARCLLGNYTFPNHVGQHFPEAAEVLEIVTIADGLRAAFGPEVEVRVERGCHHKRAADVDLDAVREAADWADVVVLAVGDIAGHFGSGTVGEGTDATSLDLPGAQQAVADAVFDAGTPTIALLVVGRPYDLAGLGRASAVVESFLPGEEGGAALAAAVTGAVNPSGKLPVSHSGPAGAQPMTYLAKPLARTGLFRREASTPWTFGFGLSYTTFEVADLVVPATVWSDGDLSVSVTVTNTGDLTGAEVVQCYLTDVAASVTRPERELAGFARVDLEPGASARVTWSIPSDQWSFTGLDLVRIVEPGALRVRVGTSSDDTRLSADVEVVGDQRVVPFGSRRWTSTVVTRSATP